MEADPAYPPTAPERPGDDQGEGGKTMGKGGKSTRKTDAAMGIFRTMSEALEEAQRRRGAQGAGPKMLHRAEESPYGGYRVRSIPVECAIDELIDPLPGGVSVFPLLPTSRRTRRYGD